MRWLVRIASETDQLTSLFKDPNCQSIWHNKKWSALLKKSGEKDFSSSPPFAHCSHVSTWCQFDGRKNFLILFDIKKKRELSQSKAEMFEMLACVTTQQIQMQLQNINCIPFQSSGGKILKKSPSKSF